MTSLFVALGLAILIAVFALQNTLPETIEFLFWEYQTALVLVILSSTAIGAALSAIASLAARWRHGRETRVLTAAFGRGTKADCRPGTAGLGHAITPMPYPLMFR
ncbi:MAG: lipopolysaccharide assembly protein LapA domain-containing protein [Nitrospira sp.]|nr:lipopolysaccharide assembly protein LapA domain-containing protein [Nitrospira sp.]MDH4252658.1 lipopolysaccharide assembly protein LapA domain-containing protein [Nitrospira sp.]MDH4342548.1 lipopolysaccharide assembly protein LapA domain-containing protein [Nitrospira sp.]MDH5336496.1 lipopolysaccharide assembly protein LapA domain-containing protein [Nitrospira sp.]